MYRRFQGSVADYQRIHYWVKRQLGNPKRCDECGKTDENARYDWANVSGQYLKDLSDWQRKCRVCHFKEDMKKEVCKHGHEISGDNLTIAKGKHRQCRTCKNITNKLYARRRRLQLKQLEGVGK